MRAAFVIAGKDLRQRLRDRTAYVVGIVAPLVLAALMAFAFGQGDQQFRATYAVADLDGGPLASAFISKVLESPDLSDMVTVRRVPDAQAAEQLTDRGSVAAAIVIPEGFSAVAEGGTPVPLRVVRNAEEPIGADVAVALAESFSAQIESVQLSVRTATAAGAPHDEASINALVQRAQEETTAVTIAESETSMQNPAATFAPAMGIFFMYFVIGTQARALVLERQRGTLVRLLAAPVGNRSLLAGKALAAFVLGAASLTATAILSAVLLDAGWGDPLSAAAVVLASTFAATAVIALVLTLARTEQQAGLYTSIVTFAFALLGGNFIGLAQAPDLLRRLALFTPNGWALRALGDLSAGVPATEAVVPAVAAITLFGLVAVAAAALRADRLVRL